MQHSFNACFIRLCRAERFPAIRFLGGNGAEQRRARFARHSAKFFQRGGKRFVQHHAAGRKRLLARFKLCSGFSVLNGLSMRGLCTRLGFRSERRGFPLCARADLLGLRRSRSFDFRGFAARIVQDAREQFIRCLLYTSRCV